MEFSIEGSDDAQVLYKYYKNKQINNNLFDSLIFGLLSSLYYQCCTYFGIQFKQGLFYDCCYHSWYYKVHIVLNWQLFVFLLYFQHGIIVHYFFKASVIQNIPQIRLFVILTVINSVRFFLIGFIISNPVFCLMMPSLYLYAIIYQLITKRISYLYLFIGSNLICFAFVLPVIYLEGEYVISLVVYGQVMLDITKSIAFLVDNKKYLRTRSWLGTLIVTQQFFINWIEQGRVRNEVDTGLYFYNDFEYE